MSLEEARKFILKHSEAMTRSHPLHTKFLRAVDLIESDKKEQLDRLVKFQDGPAAGRMRR